MKVALYSPILVLHNLTMQHSNLKAIGKGKIAKESLVVFAAKKHGLNRSTRETR